MLSDAGCAVVEMISMCAIKMKACSLLSSIWITDHGCGVVQGWSWVRGWGWGCGWDAMT